MVIAQVAGLVGCCAAGAEMPMSELRDGVAAHDAAVRAIAFRAVYQVQGQRSQGGNTGRSSQVLDCTIQDESFRVNIAYQARLAENPGKLVSRTLLVTKDKRDCRQLLRGGPVGKCRRRDSRLARARNPGRRRGHRQQIILMSQDSAGRAPGRSATTSVAPCRRSTSLTASVPVMVPGTFAPAAMSASTVLA